MPKCVYDFGFAEMLDFLNQPVIQAALSLLILVVVTALGHQWVSRLRDLSRKSEDLTRETPAKFEEMRREGDISEAEFRKIEAVLGRNGAKKEAGSGVKPSSSQDPS